MSFSCRPAVVRPTFFFVVFTVIFGLIASVLAGESSSSSIGNRAAAHSTECDRLLKQSTRANCPPQGFIALFNGCDLSGWRGLGHFDPRELQQMTSEQRADKQQQDDADMRLHWSVDNGEIVSDGHGVFLTTERDFGNFELLVDWKMVEPNGDSGIYLRGCPQVQIWDPNNLEQRQHGNEHGSGGLWNNNPDCPGRFPLVKADKPIGQWNTFRIKMVGQRVTVHFNDQLVVDHAEMHNYFDRLLPVFPTGVIQLQTHGSETRFRNLYLRELP